MNGELFKAVQGSWMGKIDILRQEVEALRPHVEPLVSSLVTRMGSPKQRYAQTETAQSECEGQVNELREYAKSLMESRTGTDHEMNLQFARAAERLSKLEEAIVDQPRQSPLQEDQPVLKCSPKKALSKKKGKTKERKSYDDSSDDERRMLTLETTGLRSLDLKVASKASWARSLESWVVSVQISETAAYPSHCTKTSCRTYCTTLQKVTEATVQEDGYGQGFHSRDADPSEETSFQWRVPHHDSRHIGAFCPYSEYPKDERSSGLHCYSLFLSGL